jgi:hypothetical protein
VTSIRRIRRIKEVPGNNICRDERNLLRAVLINGWQFENFRDLVFLGEVFMMMNVMRAAGKWGSIFALIALAILVLRQVVVFIGFLTFAIKAALVLAFLALLLGVAFMIFRSWQQHKKEQEGQV